MADVDQPGEGHDFRMFIRQLGLELGTTSGSMPSAANDADSASEIQGELLKVCQDGERTEQLTYLSGRLIGGGLKPGVATQVCLAWNARNEPPLPEDKVIKTVASIARTHARNHPTAFNPDTPLFDLQAASVGRFFDSDPPDRDWVTEDCIPMGKTALMIAPGGTGKSQIVLQTAIDIATGQKRFSPWAPGQIGQVVIIGAEDEDDEFHRRVRRLTDSGGAGRDAHQTFQALRENLYIVSRVAENNLMTMDDGGEVVQTGFVERLADTLKPLTNLRLIVIDPVARFRGGEENSAEDTTRFVEAAEKLAKLTGAAVLLVHHANKASMQGVDQNQAAARGSSALSDGVRMQINLAPLNAEDKARLGLGLDVHGLVAKITKTNYSAAGVPIYLQRDDEGRLVPVVESESRKALREVQFDILAEIVNAEDSEGRKYSKSTFAATFGGKDGRFRMGQAALKALIDKAVDAGHLEISTEKSKYLRVRGTVAPGVG